MNLVTCMILAMGHLQVALRLKRSGYAIGCSAGDTIPYIICCEQGTSSSSSRGIAQRARHPCELKSSSGKWIIDIEYYLSQQIHPVVSRLCVSIRGTAPARLADCLGLDSSKLQNKSSEVVNNDPSSLLLCPTNDDEGYRGCEPLVLLCPSCSMTLKCPTVFSSIYSSISGKTVDCKESDSNFWQKLRCPKCLEEGDRGKFSSPLIANQYTEADLYKQLAYFGHTLDTGGCSDKVDAKIQMLVEKELARIRPFVHLAASNMDKFCDGCAYGWVQLKDLAVTV